MPVDDWEKAQWYLKHGYTGNARDVVRQGVRRRNDPMSEGVARSIVADADRIDRQEERRRPSENLFYCPSCDSFGCRC